ncbi:Ku protein [Natranaerobius thermophilus]|uniref:Non-homologous end joining protein Ku n=1 Tax=Natranaerobius thermophilus (strain ATCC BAA-1301 / DSM 18059 / JW/NM-WN-LF) TaxID=457570 RepID=B2A482_NATTJ|nr:Ku protein [Natranaerobius thermophilus]ACB83736.1 Ku protein [Natranaerobius thermophilus JW/NM-WN-LF]
MRPLWKGAISFGLVNVPVKMYAATEKKNVKFRYLHRDCNAPVEYKRVCSNCKKEVPYEEIVKGYEYEPGKFVVLEDEDFEALPQEEARSINIVEFVNLSEIDPVYYDKTYYLTPQETGEKPYQLLKQVLKEKGKVAVCKVVIRSKSNLSCIRIYDEVLTLETMYFPDEVRNPKEELEIEEQPEVMSRELEMAGQLVDSLEGEFQPENYQDEYREHLMDLIKAKIHDEDVTIPERPKDERVVNLMEALEKSVDLVKEKSG